MRASTSRATRKWAPGNKLGYLVPPLSLTERQITLEVRQCKADIDIHHGEHGEHGVLCTEVRGNNILHLGTTPDMITIISNHQTYTF